MKGFIACLLVIIAALLAVIAWELVGRNLQDASLGGERGTDPEGKVDATVRMPDDGRKELPIRWVLRGDPVPDSVIPVPSPNDLTVGGEEKKPLPTLNIVRKEKNPLCDRVGPKTEMKGADLSGCDLSGKDLQVADFSNANLSDANLAGADLRDADLRDANLSGANLRGAKLFRTNLQGTDVTNADFRDATDVNLQGAKGTPAHLPTELEAAESELAEPASEGNEEAEVYYSRGRGYYYDGDYHQAIKNYSKAIELKPDDAAFWNNRGAAYYDKGDYDQAIKNYSKAIELKPDDATSWNSRGAAYYDKGDYDQAIKDYSKAIELKPDDAASWNNRGLVYNNKDEYEKAIVDYSQAIRLNLDYTEAYYNRGRVYYRKGEYDKAIADLTEVILLKKDLAEAYALRSIIYAEKGWFEAAKVDYNKVFSLQSRAAYEMRLANRLSRRSARAHQGWDTSALLTANEAGNVIGQFILLGYCSSSDKERIGREMVKWVDTDRNKVAIRHVHEALRMYGKRYLGNEEFYRECEKELRRRFRK